MRARWVAYTQHARGKFEVLRQHAFEVTPDQVEGTLLRPERVIPQSGGRFIAQKGLTARHVLRFISREAGDTRVVITFYPGRRDRYEGEL